MIIFYVAERERPAIRRYVVMASQDFADRDRSGRVPPWQLVSRHFTRKGAEKAIKKSCLRLNRSLA